MTDDDPRGRDLLCKIALAHHLDFDFAAADGAWSGAGALPGRARARSTPTERLVVAKVRDFPRCAPGYSYNKLGVWLTSELFAGLLRLERGLNVTLDTAARLQVSEDGLRYTARLRPDAVWSDGEPLKAGDFAFAWHEIRRRGLATAHLLEDVADTSEIDDATLEIRLNKACPYFVYLLALPYLFPWPRHVCDQAGEAWLRPPRSVSNGPFVLAELAEHYGLLVANERWQGTGVETSPRSSFVQCPTTSIREPGNVAMSTSSSRAVRPTRATSSVDPVWGRSSSGS
jgi:ABC-type oligopeptide transport system substrate-binding subunit